MRELIDALEAYQSAKNRNEDFYQRQGYHSEHHAIRVAETEAELENALNNLIDARVEKKLKEMEK